MSWTVRAKELAKVFAARGLDYGWCAPRASVLACDIRGSCRGVPAFSTAPTSAPGAVDLKSDKGIEDFLNPLLTAAVESPTLESQRTVQARRDAGLPVYNWGLGASPFPPPPYVVEALRRHAHERAYTPVEGIPELRNAIAARYRCKPNQVLVEQLKSLIFHVQWSFNDAAEIFHVAPFWPTYAESTQLLGKRATVIETTQEADFKLLPEQLDAALSKRELRPYATGARVLLFNSPGNPTGTTYTAAELRALAAVLTKHSVIVICDEVYGWLKHGREAEHVPSLSHYHTLTIRASSLSKAWHLGGWRLGWMVFPEPLMRLLETIKCVGSSTYSCAPAPMQYAALEAFHTRNADESAAYMRLASLTLELAGELVVKGVRHAGLYCTPADAAWYVLIGFDDHKDKLKKRGVQTSQQLVENIAKETGIIFMAGQWCGLRPEQLFVRGSYVDFDGEAALKAARAADERGWASAVEVKPWLGKIDESLKVLKEYVESL